MDCCYSKRPPAVLCHAAAADAAAAHLGAGVDWYVSASLCARGGVVAKDPGGSVLSARGHNGTMLFDGSFVTIQRKGFLARTTVGKGKNASR